MSRPAQEPSRGSTRAFAAAALDKVVEVGQSSRVGVVRKAAGWLDLGRVLAGLDTRPLPDLTPPERVMGRGSKPAFAHGEPVPAAAASGDLPGRGAAADPVASTATTGPSSVEKGALVKIYFTRSCPYTRAALGLFAEREIEHEAIDVTDDETQRSWLRIVTKSKTTPQIFVAGEPIGGFTELRALDQSGELTARLRAAQTARNP